MTKDWNRIHKKEQRRNVKWIKSIKETPPIVLNRWGKGAVPKAVRATQLRVGGNRADAVLRKFDD